MATAAGDARAQDRNNLPDGQAPNATAPAQAAPQPPAPAAAAPPPDQANRPGFLHQLKVWWDGSIALFDVKSKEARVGADDASKKPDDTVRGSADTAKDAAKDATKDATKSAATATGDAMKNAVEATKGAAATATGAATDAMKGAVEVTKKRRHRDRAAAKHPGGRVARDLRAGAQRRLRLRRGGGERLPRQRFQRRQSSRHPHSGEMRSEAAAARSDAGRALRIGNGRHPRRLPVSLLSPPPKESFAAMMSEADRHKAADTLLTAEKTRKQAAQLSKTWPDITIEDAYAISTEVAKRKIAAGATLIGHKVGLTSKAMQRSSQIDEPDYGHLLDYMMVPDGGRVPHENYCLPRVEIELAFILGKPLKGPGVQLHDVLRATDYVVPAIEIVDARLQDQRKIFDTVSDNGAAAGIVIGGRPVGPLDVDLRWVGGIMYRNSEIEETGVAAGVLGHPALGVAWLANKLGAHGVTLEPGHLVLAGSFTRVVHAKKGDTLHADFGALGGIALQFV